MDIQKRSEIAIYAISNKYKVEHLITLSEIDFNNLKPLITFKNDEIKYIVITTFDHELIATHTYDYFKYEILLPNFQECAIKIGQFIVLNNSFKECWETQWKNRKISIKISDSKLLSFSIILDVHEQNRIIALRKLSNAFKYIESINLPIDAIIFTQMKEYLCAAGYSLSS